jgi:hypothetical protein
MTTATRRLIDPRSRDREYAGLYGWFAREAALVSS